MNSKKKTDIHLKILNALDIIDRFLIEDDESYLINQLLVFSDDIVIESIILFIEQRKFEKILLLSTFLSDIPKYPSLPYKLLEHMKTLDTDTDLLFRYYFFYSTLFLSGYGLSKNAIEIAEILDIDLDLYDVWINKKKKNFEKENDEFDPPNIFDVIEDIEPIKNPHPLIEICRSLNL